MTGLAEMWRRRLLLYELTRREFKGRYSSAKLGVAWAILNPLLMMAILSLVFGHFVRIDVGETPYPVFALSALVLWQMFRSSVAGASSSIVDNRQIIKAVAFPRAFVPLSLVLSGLLNLVLTLPILFALMLLCGCRLHATALVLPVTIALLFAFTLGLSLVTSALAVYYRDVKHIMEPVLLVVFYMSPIFYPAGLVPAGWRWLYDVNPLVGIIGLQRDALLTGTLRAGNPLFWALAGTLAALAAGIIAYRRYAADFADMV